MRHTDHIISTSVDARTALQKLDEVPGPKTLFVLDQEARLVGTLTDGDVRRGLLRGQNVNEPVTSFMFRGFRYLRQGHYGPDDLMRLRNDDIRLVPVVNDQMQLRRVADLRKTHSLLPLDAVVMAGGRGERLRPLTDTVPKPLLPVGGKPIIEYNIDRLLSFGVESIVISIKYLGQQLIDYFGDGSARGARINYVTETEPLGTMGAVSLVSAFEHETVLVMNSDLLTDIDFEDFYRAFLSQGADMAIATIPYQVNVPYAVLEVEDECIRSFKEKPTYTYYSNAGIYLIKRDVLARIPRNVFYNATDLMQELIAEGRRVVSYPFLGYWLDIGKPDDYQRAQDDITRLKL